MDLRCEKCGALIGKRVSINHGEFKCRRCGHITVYEPLDKLDGNGTIKVGKK